MLLLGSHVGMSGKEMFLGSVKEALSYGANTFMIYTGAPQNTIRTPLDKLKIKEALALAKENNININEVVVHAPYLINLGNLNKEKSEVSYNILLNSSFSIVIYFTSILVIKLCFYLLLISLNTSYTLYYTFLKSNQA